MRPIPLGGGRHALILRVSRSPARPHVVHFKKHWRFYGRGETGKFPMNYAQVGQAFLSSGNTEDRITQFRDERLRKIRSGETPVPIEGKARAVLHLVPFSAFDSPDQEITLDTRRPPLNQGLLQALSWGGSLYHNFDSLLADAQMAGVRCDPGFESPSAPKSQLQRRCYLLPEQKGEYMAHKKSKTYTPKFKFQLVLEVLQGECSEVEIGRAYGVHHTTISKWKRHFLEHGARSSALTKR